MIYAKIIADSYSPENDARVTTVEVQYPRFIHSELMTHRVFSRNSASSRAIPIEKMLARIAQDPAMPVEWGSNQSGMQAGPPLTGRAAKRAERQWRRASKSAMRHADKLRKLGVHKQIANRILEPFVWHTVIITSTEWDNFFAQRCHPDAQPEIRRAAELIRDAIQASTPRTLRVGEWHLPYVRDDEQSLALSKRVKISVARCARVSYLTHDGVRDIEKDIELFTRLTTAEPPHWSPLEHVATPLDLSRPVDGRCWESEVVDAGNFRGFGQLRHNLHLLDPTWKSWMAQVNGSSR